ncbi:aminotransferase class III-fold pyridoxal phosphate-dependent enzyme [Ruicaihuangia caeni]|uniref:Aminotransferase class III-fold pyridoxal phosphate-dependent enzyme n=1 Tax=Ruicaihuangia caeni TaxID=3042517 RepID=A0AAW6T8T7_9MICO|nr:aminotransferase class III-fold pyridoxal phosphate-dependent enzyme [Klugiella sp. YN-L-19]MDI2099639.1 aminotransferase class III-fold pyridoxal phosphate-dependent enzyme [Klugiella sp. YN-L-19]
MTLIGEPATASSNSTWGTERIIESDMRYVIRSWSQQGKPAQAAIARGEGSWFWDTDGKKYLDFQSQLVNMNLGHQHPRLVEAIVRQVREMAYMGPGFAVQVRAELGELIAEIAPGDLSMSFFTTGGAEANENAVRLAQHVTGRPKVMARYRSYHGATAGALSLTGDPRHHHNGPGVPGVVRFHDPYTYRTPSGQEPENCPVCQGAPHLEEVLQYEDPNTIAAIIVETVTGTNGLIVPPDGYLQSVREVADKYGIFLITDEVMAGYGRTGEWFAFNHWGIVPDIVTSAKGLNSGYVPLGAMTVGDRARQWLNQNKFWGGQTYAGHPLACASALESLKIMQDEHILENVRTQGARLDAGLRKLAERYQIMGDVRGKGLFYGVEFVTDRATREPLVPFGAAGAAAAPMQRMVAEAWEKGLYLSANNNVLRLTPPLIITEDEIDFALEILDDVIGAANARVHGPASQ